jgi:glycosyltransferase involved in cell wall biosynthesis
MKVLIASGAYPPHIIGGGEIATQRLAEALQESGLEVSVLAGCSYDAEETVNGIRVIRARFPHAYWLFEHLKVKRRRLAKRAMFHLLDAVNVWSARVVERHVAQERPDILLISVVDGLSPAIFRLGRMPAVKIVYVLRSFSLMCVHNAMFKNGHICQTQCGYCQVYALPRRSYARHIDGVISVSQDTLERHLAAGFFERVPAAVIGDVVDAPQEPRRHAVSKPLHFGFIGQLVPEKGFELILDALRDDPLRQQCRLLVAGSGRDAYVQELQAQAEGGPVEWLGWVRPQDFYSRIDVLIVPSVWPEPQGLVVLEAFSYGVPVIVTRNGGLPENVRDGETGFCLRDVSGESLRETMKGIVAAPDRLPAMRDKARAYAAQFSREVLADKYTRFLERVVAGQASSAQDVAPAGDRGVNAVSRPYQKIDAPRRVSMRTTVR